MEEQDVSIGNDVTMRGESADAIAVIDQFVIVRKLGGGGFGSVYLARDTVAGVDVAVKGLPPIVRNNTEELERIRANFALVSRLHHPYIAAALHLHRVQLADYRVNGVYESLNVGPGDTLMVMEYAPGVTLSQWRKQFPGGKVPLEVAVNLVYQVAMALDYSHSNQILHRDIKPSNIMVETKEDGATVARVLDFGLAAEIKSSMGRVSMEIHDTSGTRPYMAPEQWAGRKQGPATDQYALACLFCELVTGEVPFASVFETGDPMVMMTSVCNRDVEFSVDCPRQHALKKALAKDPGDRYVTCAEFVENLAKSESRFDTEQVDMRGASAPSSADDGSFALQDNGALSDGREKDAGGLGHMRSNRLFVSVMLLLGVAVLAGAMLFWRSGLLKEDVEKQRIARLVEDGTQSIKDAVEMARLDAEKIRRDAEKGRSELSRQQAEAVNAAEEAKAKAERQRRVEEELARETERRASAERVAELQAKKSEADRVALERKIELAKIEQQRAAEEKRKEQERIDAAKRMCKNCHGLGNVWERSVCGRCGGSREAEADRQCAACKGDGSRANRTTCPACKGKGKVREKCSACHGNGTVVCSSCNGSGGSMQRTYVPGIAGYNRALRKVKVDCSSCGGSGRMRCWHCNGGTLVDCARCDGSGYVSRNGSCSVCNGTGRVREKSKCDDCEDGFVYSQNKCDSCEGEGKRILVGIEKADVFDGISIRMPMSVEYLPLTLVSAMKIPRGWRAQFSVVGTGSAAGSSSGRTLSAAVGEEIGSTGWIFRSYEQKEARKEVAGVKGMFRNVDISEAVLLRKTDGKIVKLPIDCAEPRIPVDMKATLVLCGLDGSKNRLSVASGDRFKLEGVRFTVKDVTLSSVTVENALDGKTKVIRPEYQQSVDLKSDDGSTMSKPLKTDAEFGA